ncbi:hypothetical protein HDU81_004265 [Chytriomyces hyalinus]|nr:hypothetical protein HDU81_004265 [Chytriomyces hyalinus]
MNSLRRTANTRPLELDTHNRDSYVFDAEAVNTDPPEYTPVAEHEDYVVIRSSLASDLNVALMHLPAQKGTVDPPDFSGAIRDIPRPVVVVEGSAAAATAAGVGLDEAGVASDGRDNIKVHGSVHTRGAAGGAGEKDGHPHGHHNGEEVSRVERLARLMREAARLEGVVAALKQRDDEADEERRRAEKAAIEEAERKKKERMMDAWLYSDSSDDENEKKKEDLEREREKEAAALKAQRKGVSNANILAGVLDLQQELVKIAATIRDSAPVRPLVLDPEQYAEKSKSMGSEFMTHIQTKGSMLRNKLATIAADTSDTIYTETQHQQQTAISNKPSNNNTADSQNHSNSKTQRRGGPLASSNALSSLGHMEAPPRHLLGITTADPSAHPVIHYQLLNTPAQEKLPQIGKLYTIESRLTGLERRIGMHYLKMHDSTHHASTINAVLQESDSVLGALDKLDHQLNIVTDVNVMASVDVEVQGVIQDMTKLLDVRRHQAELTEGYGGGNLLANLQQQQQKLKAAAAALTNTIDDLENDHDSDDEVVEKDVSGLADTSVTATPKPAEPPATPTTPTNPRRPLSQSAKRASRLLSSPSTSNKPSAAAAADAQVAHTALKDLQKQTSETETEKRVLQLYTRIHTHDALISQLPYLVTRFYSLRAVHLQASDLSTRLQRITQEQMKTVDGLRGVEGLAKVVEDGIVANDKAVKINFEALDLRLAELLKRANGERRVAAAAAAAVDAEKSRVEGEDWVNVGEEEGSGRLFGELQAADSLQRNLTGKSSRGPSPVRSDGGYEVNL